MQKRSSEGKKKKLVSKMLFEGSEGCKANTEIEANSIRLDGN